jgi:hypothetical protein
MISGGRAFVHRAKVVGSIRSNRREQDRTPSGVVGTACWDRRRGQLGRPVAASGRPTTAPYKVNAEVGVGHGRSRRRP